MPRAPQKPAPTEHASTDRGDPKVALKRVRAKAPPAGAGAPSRERKPATSHWGIGLGDRVRVVAGPFSGKVGVVQELDAKGGARVMLGLLVVRFEFENLTPQVDGRARPVLGSSHRKPMPARS
jgi:transcription antitermination factor NusG